MPVHAEFTAGFVVDQPSQKQPAGRAPLTRSSVQSLAKYVADKSEPETNVPGEFVPVQGDRLKK
jgi:hypothetical protein